MDYYTYGLKKYAARINFGSFFKSLKKIKPNKVPKATKLKSALYTTAAASAGGALGNTLYKSKMNQAPMYTDPRVMPYPTIK
jgi:hypothetical protein